MIIALDTNCLLRWLMNDVPSQKDRVDALLQSPDTQAHVADLAIAEIVWVMDSVYQFDRSAIARNITKIVENKLINCNRRLFEAVLPVYLEHKGISFTDACLATYVSLSDAKKLLTFDKKLARSLPLLAEEL